MRWSTIQKEQVCAIRVSFCNHVGFDLVFILAHLPKPFTSHAVWIGRWCFTPTRKIWRSRWSCGVLDWMVSCSLVPVPCLQSSQFLSSGPGWYKLTSKTLSIGIAFGFLCSSKINVLTHSPEPKGFDAEHDSNPFKWPPFLFTHPCFSENTKEICCIALCSLDVCPGSPLPFPLPKGWTRAGYHPLLRGEFMQKKMESCTGFCSKRACAASCSGFSFFENPLENRKCIWSDLFWDALGHTGNPIAIFCQSC